MLLAAAPDVAGRLRRRVLEPFASLPSEEREELLATVRAYVDASCSASAAASALGCHRNTVGQRLRRITGLTGRPLDPSHLLELQLVLGGG